MNALRRLSKGMISSRKLLSSADEAVKLIKSGDTVLAGGFGLAGVPFSLLKAITRRPELNGLTFVSNTAGTDKHGLSLVIASGQAKKMMCSYVGENKLFEQAYLGGKLEVDLIPQGTLAEKMRAAGAGIAYFSTPTGVGTLVETGGFISKYTPDKKPEIYSKGRDTVKDPRTGKKLLLEPALHGDVGIVKASIADESGNLIFNKSTNNFNVDIAKASKIVIAEVEKIVPAGSLDPSHIHLSGIFVDKMILTEEKEKPFEKIVNTRTIAEAGEKLLHKDQVRRKIAERAAKDIFDGAVINLGIGIPVLIPVFVNPKYDINIHAENGIMGVNGYPEEGHEDPDLINPAKETVTVKKDASFFSSADSFGIVRGGHLDFTFLGTMEVDQQGDLANWVIPGKFLKGMGGAMDLVSSGSPVIVCTEHIDKHKNPKVVAKCSLPLTGINCVTKIITNWAVFDVKPDNKGLLLKEIAEEVDLATVINNTGCEFEVSKNLKKF